jgi:hypothetical protein
MCGWGRICATAGAAGALSSEAAASILANSLRSKRWKQQFLFSVMLMALWSTASVL